MDITQLSLFVEATARSSGVTFTLDGEQITPKDLGDPHGLLPLVVASANFIHEQISGQRPSHMSLIEPADPKTHLLGWRVKALPSIPTGAYHLMVNHAVRTLLTRQPEQGLTNPFLPDADIKSEKRELREHLDALNLSGQRTPNKLPYQGADFSY